MEQAFVKAQENRRETQRSINEVQAKLKALHSELERTFRGEDRYLELVTQVNAACFCFETFRQHC